MTPAGRLAPHDARHAGAGALARALVASRQDTLAAFEAFRAHLPGLAVAYDPCINPPLWELGHVGWFQEFWVARNPALADGARADPDAPRRGAWRANADALYDSSRVAHRTRWTLPLPEIEATRDDLARQLDATLALLARSGDDDDALYFFRLALLHEDMHHEAATYVAQALDVLLAHAPAPAPLRGPRTELAIAGGRHRIGFEGGGFAFDNELAAFEVELAPFAIDARPVTWREFLPFVEDDGYARRALWSDEGARWLEAGSPRAPRYLARVDGAWTARRFGRLLPLDLDEPACHLSWFEADAWCRWAGRRLPTEFEWEAAARAAPAGWTHGAVWEWTASPFAPYAGFAPHPYRDYSAPWFDGRPVLRGASFATSARLRDARYRNFFRPERNDLFAGLRSCAA